MTWTEAWAEAQASAPANIVELFTVELIHSSFLDAFGNPTSVRAVRDVQDHVLLLEDSAPLGPGTNATFTAIPFDVPWPGIEDGRVPELQIRIDNVGQELAPWLDAAVLVQAPITVIFRIYLWDESAGTTTMGTDPITFQMRSVTISDTYVEGTASPADLANLQFLRVIYDVLNYPGLSHT